VDPVDAPFQYVPSTLLLLPSALPSLADACSPCPEYPILLTAWHLTFSTIMTQILARTTTLLDGRKKIKMTGRVYLRAIVPIGFAFSLSLMCGNMTYLYLSVSFIQMLKVRAIPPLHNGEQPLTVLGHHARRSPPYQLGSSH
jgi:hypothetical protein